MYLKEAFVLISSIEGAKKKLSKYLLNNIILCQKNRVRECESHRIQKPSSSKPRGALGTKPRLALLPSHSKFIFPRKLGIFPFTKQGIMIRRLMPYQFFISLSQPPPLHLLCLRFQCAPNSFSSLLS